MLLIIYDYNMWNNWFYRVHTSDTKITASDFTWSTWSFAAKGTDQANFGDEEVQQNILDSVKESQELRAQGLLLPDAERALAAFEKANAMPPTVIANSNRQGDSINQTQISASELSSEHSDITAKTLANAID